MIAIGSDHGGYALKQEIMAYLKEKQIAFEDFGCYSEESCDYPDIAQAVCEKILDHSCEKGILICGTGIGKQNKGNPRGTLQRLFFCEIYQIAQRRKCDLPGRQNDRSRISL